MPQVPFTELLPEVLATAPSCPMPTVVRNLRHAARELCEKAKCWRVDVEGDPIAAGEAEYMFYVPEDTVMVAPISLTIDGRPLNPGSLQILNADSPDWRTRIGPPTQYLRSADEGNSIRLYMIPDRRYDSPGIYGEIAVKPTRTAMGVSELFMDRYGNALVEGALARLLMIPSDWYAPNQSSYHLAAFQTAIDAARAYANGDDLPKRRTVRYGGI